jgi:hypothetical protein
LQMIIYISIGNTVIPAPAGIQGSRFCHVPWAHAFARATEELSLRDTLLGE